MGVGSAEFDFSIPGPYKKKLKKSKTEAVVARPWAISNPSSPLPPFAQPAQATPPTTWSTHVGVVPSNVPTRGGRGGAI